MTDSTAPEGRTPLSDDELERIRDLADDDIATVRDMRLVLAELERLNSWHGLMSVLDEKYPEGIFPTREDDDTRDPGPRIVSLLRWVDRIRAENTALAAKLESVGKVHFEKSSLVFEMSWCFACGDNWPCPTARALGGDQDGGDRDA